jgi:signal transduction histidine kinase
MRERVLMFSGSLDVESSASGGVAIEVHLPFKHPPAVSVADPVSAATTPAQQAST